MKCDHKETTCLNNFDLKNISTLYRNAYKCKECGYLIPAIVEHFTKKYPHAYLFSVGPFTDWQMQKELIQGCLQEYWRHWPDAVYQPPHAEHDLDADEERQEEEYQNFANHHWWLKNQYAAIISHLLTMKELI